MELFDAISRRKSCRKYTGKPLDEAQLDEIRAAIAGFWTLYPDVPLDFRFTDETRGMFKVDAPHYLIISGEGRPGEAESAGFLFEQLALWFDTRDIGCVWLGKAKDVRQSSDKDILSMAFGPAEGPAHRGESEFQRKAIGEITNAPEDACLRAVRLAPSGMNLQPWYFEKSGDIMLVYEQILKPPMSLVYKKTAVDMGIALCHYRLACEREGREFAFARRSEGPERKGYRLFGEIR